MSAAVDVDSVVRVCVGGYWYDVSDGSFEVDAYRFTYDGRELSIPDLGAAFQFRSGDVVVTGPLSAVHVVEHTPVAAADPVSAALGLFPGHEPDPQLDETPR